MSLNPIQVLCNCWLCGHSWVEERNTVDAFEAICPECGDDFLCMPSLDNPNINI